MLISILESTTFLSIQKHHLYIFTSLQLIHYSSKHHFIFFQATNSFLEKIENFKEILVACFLCYFCFQYFQDFISLGNHVEFQNLVDIECLFWTWLCFFLTYPRPITYGDWVRFGQLLYLDHREISYVFYSPCRRWVDFSTRVFHTCFECRVKSCYYGEGAVWTHHWLGMLR